MTERALRKARREVARDEPGLTPVCLQYAHGKCKLGDRCEHRHDPVAAAAVVLRWKHGNMQYNPKGICMQHAFAADGCRAGDSCPDSHNEAGTLELRIDRSRCTGLRVCFKFIKNKCGSGDRCVLSHDR